MCQEFKLPLTGLNCGRCVAKVEDALSKNDAIFSYDVSKTDLNVIGTLTHDEIQYIIEELGYSVPKPQEITLFLSGLNCGKCVNKTKDKLNQLSHTLISTLTKTEVTLVSPHPLSVIIHSIEDLGFQASITPLDQGNAASISTSPTPSSATITSKQNNSEHTIQLILSGMTCASCVTSVEKIILNHQGIKSAQVNLAERTALVTGATNIDALITAIHDGGYGAEISENEEQRRKRQQDIYHHTIQSHKRNTLLSLSIGAPLMLWGLLGGNMQINTFYDQLSWGIIGLICLGLLLTAGKHFFVNAWKSFTHHRATMDTLVSLGTGAAWLYSMALVIAPGFFPEQARHVYFEATAMILGLITLGNLIETKARHRTSSAIEKLLNLQPQTATVIQDGKEITVAISQVKKDMLIKIKPGERIPVDGMIITGESYLDEAMLTGEPLPCLKKINDKVHAGTINQQGSFTFQATQVGEHTMLARIIAMVRTAQSSKPKLAQLADKVSAVFVPSVMIIAIFSALIWYNLGPEPTTSYMLVVATTVLIIACPCALGLATPMSVTVGVGKAAEFGALIKDADVLQTASTIDTVVIDKTGTLTEGKPTVTNIITFDEYRIEQVVSYASSVEIHSEHPLAHAVINYATKNHISYEEAHQFSAVLGLGAKASLQEAILTIGSAAFLLQENITIPTYHVEKASTPLFIALNKTCIGIIEVSDQLRNDSKSAIQQFAKMGIDTVMLTGDRKETADYIADKLGITHVISGVLPDGKAQVIKDLQQQGKQVAMIGDGINDAPALAQAEVGIAMGSGSDVAIESAQLTLMNHSLHTAVNAIELSKATIQNMKQNLFGAFIYNTIGIPIAAGALFPLTGILLSPVVAGAAMALSSITVVTNANRLRLFTPTATQSIGGKND